MSSALSWRLFSFNGRVNRSDYAILFFGLFAIHVVIDVFVFTRCVDLAMIKAHRLDLAVHMSPGVRLALILAGLAMGWTGLANAVKRLHDFGWSGWMILAPGGAMLVAIVAAALLSGVAGLKAVGGGVIVSGAVVVGIGSLALQGIMFFRRGDEGENGHSGGPGANRDDDGPARASGPTSPPVPRAPKDERQLSVYRAPQVRSTSFGRRSA